MVVLVYLKRLSPGSKDKIVQFEALKLLLKTNGDKIKPYQTKTSLSSIKAKAVTSNGPIWVQTQAHKNREWNK